MTPRPPLLYRAGSLVHLTIILLMVMEDTPDFATRLLFPGEIYHFTDVGYLAAIHL